MRANSSTLSFTLETWRQVYTVYQNRRSFAIQRHLARIQYDALLKWRVQLRARLKLLKHAKTVEKFIVQRRTLNVWKSKLTEKRRQDKLKVLEARRLGGFMRSKHPEPAPHRLFSATPYSMAGKGNSKALAPYGRRTNHYSSQHGGFRGGRKVMKF